jgi:hypothetical protein
MLCSTQLKRAMRFFGQIANSNNRHLTSLLIM